MKGEKFMKLTILGIQGCGKGTQAKRIAKEYGIPHISTGDIFRKAMAEQTPLGVEAQGYVNSGNLVPDSLTINLVKERVAQEDCANGYILDGFPRNMAQAEAFESQLDKAIYIDVDEDTTTALIRIEFKLKQDENGLWKSLEGVYYKEGVFVSTTFVFSCAITSCFTSLNFCSCSVFSFSSDSFFLFVPFNKNSISQSA